MQGVGFRPFICRLAIEHQLSGWVRNCLGQVEIHVQGLAENIAAFELAIFSQTPAIARPVPLTSSETLAVAVEDFSIRESLQQGHVNISVPADLFTCEDCLSEMHNPQDRRYRYAFINCTQCGPRYTLIRALPYDRASTTMAGFTLCASCRAEYENPMDRRYHAEPVACPVCGPRLEYKNAALQCIEQDDEAVLKACANDLRDGKVIAVKGIGGYHLMCDASNDDAVLQLRRNKPRAHKPLAVIFPSNMQQPFAEIRKHLHLTAEQEKFLAAPSRPILLVNKTANSALSENIAPGLNEIGAMLPYSPLHHLLLNAFGKALVATSANLSGEPVLIDNNEVESRLGHVAEAFLHHNRPIERPADDPVFRFIRQTARPIRLGRGDTPLELKLPFKLDKPVLAVGAQMKNTLCLAWENRAVISPHIGEMDNARSLAVFEKTIVDLQQLYRVEAEVFVCDAHPSYTTTRWTRQQDRRVYKVVHHHAHAAAAYYEANINSDMLVFTWDGVGYGEDATLWGGEALLGRPAHWQRFASFEPFRLPGGERAGREPWRSAAALCWQAGIEFPTLPAGGELLHEAWQKNINSPLTSSVGRLFDAAAALTGVCAQASFEGQGPMYLEARCSDAATAIDLPLNDGNGIWLTDWLPLLAMLMDDSSSIASRSSCFHASLASVILQQSNQARKQHNITDIGFSGGVFQNRVLTEMAAELLESSGFSVHIPATIPMNDAGISFGQIIEYLFTIHKTL